MEDTFYLVAFGVLTGRAAREGGTGDLVGRPRSTPHLRFVRVWGPGETRHCLSCRTVLCIV